MQTNSFSGGFEKIPKFLLYLRKISKSFMNLLNFTVYVKLIFRSNILVPILVHIYVSIVETFFHFNLYSNNNILHNLLP